jgi:hypothetical protein
MLNQKSSVDDGKRKSNKEYFPGFLQRFHSTDNTKWKDTKDFVYLKVYESMDSIPDKKGNYTFKMLDCYKEFDLLLISQ